MTVASDLTAHVTNAYNKLIDDLAHRRHLTTPAETGPAMDKLAGYMAFLTKATSDVATDIAAVVTARTAVATTLATAVTTAQTAYDNARTGLPPSTESALAALRQNIVNAQAAYDKQAAIVAAMLQ